MNEGFTRGFVRVFETHLENLGWSDNRKAFASMSGISDSQISDWIRGVRLPGRDRINQICWALAKAYEEQREQRKKDGVNVKYGIDKLDGMLNEMLQAVGYSPIIGAEQDLIWTRLAEVDHVKDRELRIAWVEYPPFAYPGHSRTADGIAVEIMDRVAKMMGATPIWVEREWSDLINKINERDVHVVCPILMELPSRVFQVAFSDMIPGIRIGISGLVQRDYENRARGGPTGINAEKLCLNYVIGEAGQALCTLFAPEATASRGHKSFDEACQAIASRGEDENGRVHCLVADHVICKAQESKYGLTTLEKADSVKLPVAAAVHLEEPKLLHMINRCLQTLSFSSILESEDGQKLEALGALTDKREREVIQPKKQGKMPSKKISQQ